MELGYKMRKKLAGILAIVMIMAMTITASATEQSEGYFGECIIAIGCASNGVSITWETNTTSTANVIGVKDIVLQEKVNGVWKDINISGGYVTNNSTYGAGGVYTSAVKGRTYRAYCTHYATWGSTTKNLSNETSEMVYN